MNGDIVSVKNSKTLKKVSKKEAKRYYWTEGEGLVEIEKWLESGLYDKQIAQNIGIAPKTLCQWKNENECFRNVFNKARNVAVLELENSAFKSARGYYVQEQVIDNKNNKRVIRKWVAPNPTIQIFLLKNWAPDKYNDRKDYNVNGSIIPIVFAGEDKLEE